MVVSLRGSEEDIRIVYARYGVFESPPREWDAEASRERKPGMLDDLDGMFPTLVGGGGLVVINLISELGVAMAQAKASRLLEDFG
jgi:hypothetical protein